MPPVFHLLSLLSEPCAWFVGLCAKALECSEFISSMQLETLLSLLVEESDAAEQNQQPQPLTIVFVERKVRPRASCYLRPVSQQKKKENE